MFNNANIYYGNTEKLKRKLSETIKCKSFKIIDNFVTSKQNKGCKEKEL